jgi:hypothetical protein
MKKRKESTMATHWYMIKRIGKVLSSAKRPKEIIVMRQHVMEMESKMLVMMLIAWSVLAEVEGILSCPRVTTASLPSLQVRLFNQKNY